MAKKKRFKGKKMVISGSGVSSTPPDVVVADPRSGGSSSSNNMSSTGPHGAKRKLLMEELLAHQELEVFGGSDQVRVPLRSEGIISHNLGISSSKVPVPLVDGGLNLGEQRRNSKSPIGNVDASCSWADEVDSGEHIVIETINGVDRLGVNSNVSGSPRVEIGGSSSHNASIPKVSVEGKKTFASLFADNRRLGKGLNLNFIPSVMDDTVSFDDEEWSEGNSHWKFALVGSVIGLNVRFKAMEMYVDKVWSNLAKPNICLLKAGIYLFNFNSEEERDLILGTGPWFFGDRPLILRPWSSEEDVESFNSSLYPLWIQLPNLKLNLWHEKGISKIASLVGKPITTDKLTANRQRLVYARVLIEVQLPAKLPDAVTIKGPNGQSYSQRKLYEFKPRWCEHCKVVGHSSETCKRKQTKMQWVPKKRNVEEKTNARVDPPVVSGNNMHKEVNTLDRSVGGRGNKVILITEEPVLQRNNFSPLADLVEDAGVDVHQECSKFFSSG